MEKVLYFTQTALNTLESGSQETHTATEPLSSLMEVYTRATGAKVSITEKELMSPKTMPSMMETGPVESIMESVHSSGLMDPCTRVSGKPAERTVEASS